MHEEEWKPIPRCPGYFASSKGRIKGRRGFLKGCILNDGYRSSRIVEDGVSRNRRFSRLIARAFLGEPESGIVVRHLNGNKFDNRIENLAYGTVKDNYEDSRRHGTNCFGEKHGCAKLTEDNVKEIRSIYKDTNLSLAELGKEYGVSRHAIFRIVKNKNWKGLKQGGYNQALDDVKKAMRGENNQ